MTQISTSVQQTTEVVVLVEAALTMRAALHVPVTLDTPMTESPAEVSHLKVDFVHCASVEIHFHCITVSPKWCCFPAEHYSILLKFGRLMHCDPRDYS